MRNHPRPRELTGRAVLIWLIGFFAIIFAVNGWLVQAATSTFGGLETQSSYKAGLMFEQDVAKAERQQALQWRVDGKLARGRDGAAVLDISVRDAHGSPVTGLSADALTRPSGRRTARSRHPTRPHRRRRLPRRGQCTAGAMGADRRFLPRPGPRVPFAQPRDFALGP